MSNSVNFGPVLVAFAENVVSNFLRHIAFIDVKSKESIQYTLLRFKTDVQKVSEDIIDLQKLLVFCSESNLSSILSFIGYHRRSENGDDSLLDKAFVVVQAFYLAFKLFKP